MARGFFCPCGYIEVIMVLIIVLFACYALYCAFQAPYDDK